ncbi:2006_t:CDS:1, partial [Entrophospora sp. SA101]
KTMDKIRVPPNRPTDIIPTAVIPTPLYRQDIILTGHYTDRTLYRQ